MHQFGRKPTEVTGGVCSFSFVRLKNVHTGSHAGNTIVLRTLYDVEIESSGGYSVGNFPFLAGNMICQSKAAINLNTFLCIVVLLDILIILLINIPLNTEN